MDYVKFGNTGMEVSRLSLGCMSFGVPERGIAPWSLPEDESRDIIKKALDLGINFFDTANVYSDGTSEEIVGRALGDYANRDEVVLATKVYFPMHKGPNGSGLSRKHIMSEMDKSLKRLGTDYVDLYIIHRWDYDTPIEETMEALHDLVKAGKTRYIGASSMYVWQLAKAQHTAKLHGWTPFASMQNLYNLLYREEEREMMPFLKDQKMAVTPWSPLAKGRLARPWDTKTHRSSNDAIGDRFFPASSESDRLIAERVAKVAEDLGVTMAQVALAWVLSKDYITSPIIGTSKVSQLESSVAALDVSLSSEQIAFLEEPYIPHQIVGFV